MRNLTKRSSRKNNPPISRPKLHLNPINAIHRAIKTERENIFQQHRELVSGHEHLLTLALNEAEALVWQTEFPHLVFPTLALEKAESIVTWKQRQQLIQRSSESAFAA